MPTNHGAWLTAPRAPLDIRPVTVLDPDLHQILIKSHAVAVNPVDWGMQMMGPERFPFIKCPCVLGHDVAGEVVAVGSAVTRFKVGDRVLGLAAGPNLNSQGQLGAFQEYTLLADNMSSPIPDGISYEEASVVPLGLSTSACGMFEKDYLALPRPSVNPTPLGKTLLVWSGASSVGSNAVQLGVAAGCDVITTCSPKNYALVKKLGASQVFDYNSETVVSDILSYLEGKVIAGALAIGNANAIRAGHGQNATKMVLEIVSRAQGNKFVALGFPYDGEIPEGVESKYIIGNSMAQNDLGAAIFANYLPRALAEGKFIPAPEPLVAGRGLESLETAFGIVRDGVSARKVVVSLE